MPQQVRSEGAAREGAPMVIDAGERGLEQSRHHPQYQVASGTPAEGSPTIQQERSDLQSKIQGILTGFGVQDPSGRLPEVLSQLVLAVRDDALAKRQLNEGHATIDTSDDAPAIIG